MDDRRLERICVDPPTGELYVLFEDIEEDETFEVDFHHKRIVGYDEDGDPIYVVGRLLFTRVYRKTSSLGGLNLETGLEECIPGCRRCRPIRRPNDE